MRRTLAAVPIARAGVGIWSLPAESGIIELVSGRGELAEVSTALNQWAKTVGYAPRRLDEHVTRVEVTDEILVRLATEVHRRDFVMQRAPGPRGGRTQPLKRVDAVDPWAVTSEELQDLTEHIDGCGPCGASGRLGCGHCRASGRMTCSNCGGDGHVWKHYKKSKRLIICQVCKKQGTVRCSVCGGDGHLTCSACRGSGCERVWFMLAENKRFDLENEPHAEVVVAHRYLTDPRFLSPRDLGAFHEHARHESFTGPLVRDAVDQDLRWLLDRRTSMVHPRFERVRAQQLLKFGVPRRDVHYELCGARSKLVLSGATFAVAATPAALRPIEIRKKAWLGGSLVLVAATWILIAATRRQGSYFNLTNFVTIGLGVLLTVGIILAFGSLTRVLRASPPRFMKPRRNEIIALVGGLVTIVAMVMVRWLQVPSADEAREALAAGDLRRAQQVAVALEETRPRASSTLDVRDEVDIERALATDDEPKRLRLLDSVTMRGRASAKRSLVEARGARTKIVDAALGRSDFVAAYKVVSEWPNRADAEEAPIVSRVEARVWDAQLRACRDLPCRWSATAKAAKAEPTPARNAARDRERGAMVAALSLADQAGEAPLQRLRRFRAASELASSIGTITDDANLEQRRTQTIAVASAERAKVPLIGASSDVMVELLDPKLPSAPANRAVTLSEVTLAWTVDAAGRCNGVYITGAKKGERSIAGDARGKMASQLLAQTFGRPVRIPPPLPGKSGASTATANEGTTSIVARYLGSQLMELRIGSARP